MRHGVLGISIFVALFVVFGYVDLPLCGYRVGMKSASFPALKTLLLSAPFPPPWLSGVRGNINPWSLIDWHVPG